MARHRYGRGIDPPPQCPFAISSFQNRCFRARALTIHMRSDCRFPMPESPAGQQGDHPYETECTVRMESRYSCDLQRPGRWSVLQVVGPAQRTRSSQEQPVRGIQPRLFGACQAAFSPWFYFTTVSAAVTASRRSARPLPIDPRSGLSFSVGFSKG